mmetsp:Transcript_10944/g.30031  ORF Transcript_10944/g.30031 Transcript_10944/m.30031 type:complete len:404 (+) Transcript_10944:138-1349(+)|eukprot:CAMPEP_0202370888 /NCGR_PEP_ID=MMETSP1127-20130417/2400_1 /ASSEMBLY_ACC=CAM_ASM_000462 /TAXON_ID=3047 /ORGANISM="Dunaliella tertiolecta, Strain CCMP1320" /LENGTH=403 /DNA_ID=CAMNT_0048966947 /DNA_START=128 /DNA_END=1339 /DNA_ORIENTATION=+
MASAEALARAIEYPYVRPVSTGHSYIFINGQVYSFRNEAWTGIQGLEGMMVNPQHHCKPVSSKDAVSTSCPPIRAKEAALQHGFDLEASVQCTNWLPVLAVGSNAAPQQLIRKFGDMYPGVFIPVVECVLDGFDVVYSPGLASYGSCPATLAHSPGTLTSVFLTYLTPRLASRMHSTEGTPYVYSLMQLHNIKLHVASSIDDTGQLSTPTSSPKLMTDVLQYNYAAGALSLPVECPEGVVQCPIALAEIPAARRRFPALKQAQLLQLLMHALDGVHLGDERRLHMPAIKKSGALYPVTFRPPDHEQANVAGFSSPEDGFEPQAESRQEGATRLEDWILDYVANPSLRRRYVKRLQAHAATQFSYDDHTIHHDMVGLGWSGPQAERSPLAHPRAQRVEMMEINR